MLEFVLLTTYLMDVFFNRHSSCYWNQLLSCSLLLGKDRYYFVKKNHSDSSKKFSETDIINMLEFLIDNIFAIFGGRIFQQTVSIPMATNCAPLLADLFLYSYEADFTSKLTVRGG